MNKYYTESALEVQLSDEDVVVYLASDVDEEAKKIPSLCNNQYIVGDGQCIPHNRENCIKLCPYYKEQEG